MPQLILTLCFFLCLHTSLFTQNGAYWQFVRAPQGILAHVEQFNGDTCFTFYAPQGTPKYLYRSTDKGLNWQEIDVTDPDPQLQGDRKLFIGKSGHLFLLLQGKLYRSLVDA